MARSLVSGKVHATTVRPEQVRAPSYQAGGSDKSLDAVLEKAFLTIEEIRGESGLGELTEDQKKASIAKLAQHIDASDAGFLLVDSKLRVDNVEIDGAAIAHKDATTAITVEDVSFLDGAISSATSIDGSGDLTMGTITMSGFTVDADGDVTAKSLDIDANGTVLSPEFKIDSDANGREGFVYMVGANGEIASSADVKWDEANSKFIVAGSLQVAGTIDYVNETNLTVVDKTVTLNKGGAAASAGSAGILFEENGVDAGYVAVSADRASIEIKAPASQYVMDLVSSADATFDLGANLTVSAASEIDQELVSTGAPSWEGLQLTGEIRGVYVHNGTTNAVESVGIGSLITDDSANGFVATQDASDAAKVAFTLDQSIKTDADFAVNSLTVAGELSLSSDGAGESKIYAGAGEGLKLEVDAGEVMTLKVGSNSLAVGDLADLGGQTLTQLLKASMPVKLVEEMAGVGFQAGSAFTFGSTADYLSAPTYHSLYLNGVRLSQADYSMSVSLAPNAGKLVATLAAVGGASPEFEQGDKLVLEIFAARS